MNQCDQRFHNICNKESLTFVNVVLDLEGGHNNDSKQSAPIASFDDEALPFFPIPWEGKSFESMQQSTTADVNPDME